MQVEILNFVLFLPVSLHLGAGRRGGSERLLANQINLKRSLSRECLPLSFQDRELRNNGVKVIEGPI